MRKGERATCGCEKSGLEGKAPGAAVTPRVGGSHEGGGHRTLVLGSAPPSVSVAEGTPPLAAEQLGGGIPSCTGVLDLSSARARSLRPFPRQNRCGGERVGIPGQGSSHSALCFAARLPPVPGPRREIHPSPSTFPSPSRPAQPRAAWATGSGGPDRFPKWGEQRVCGEAVAGPPCGSWRCTGLPSNLSSQSWDGGIKA